MAIDDDIALLAGVPSLRLLGIDALRVLAISSEHREYARGDYLFRAGDAAAGGYVVQYGGFRVRFEDSTKQETVARPGDLIGELALIAPMARPASAVAIDYSSVIQINRTLFQRVLESDPAAARRLRDDLAGRTSEAISTITLAGAKLLD